MIRGVFGSPDDHATTHGFLGRRHALAPIGTARSARIGTRMLMMHIIRTFMTAMEFIARADTTVVAKAAASAAS